ncbi:uncharacterized protein LOC116299633 isoform X1 [Actinia tenebrosa]|uniref:Uncharacterized protein LOC116299633 isoform X1 n=1 Tax=Actinia tenebrosa TaxID=6105 RepID=A0A6P8I814_ACTTE|nr:uncharacterized protein LOC116299633 isoform X1 [Actinia tenebrosa]
MSCSFKKGVSLKQGSKTSTVLTNRSSFITIVTDEPYETRCAGPRTEAHRKGVRPLNKSTLCLEISPLKTSYESCMKSSFSGSKNLQPSKRPSAFPSQHTSQFNIGIASDHMLDTHVKKTYVHHNIVPTNQLHEHNQRWNNQMSGKDMVESTRQNKCSEMTFNTTYSTIHDKLGMERGPGSQMKPPMRRKFDILTGEPLHLSQQEDFHLTSRNRILHNMRHGKDFQNSFILG